MQIVKRTVTMDQLNLPPDEWIRIFEKAMVAHLVKKCTQVVMILIKKIYLASL